MNNNDPSLDQLRGKMNAMVDNLLGRPDGMVKVAHPTAAMSNKSYQTYRNSFLTMGDLQIPDDYREIFRWCRYFFKFDPLIGPVVRKLATFPITDYVVNDSEWAEENDDIEDDENSPEFKFYENMLRDLNLHKLLIEIGYDYYLYGNCIVLAEPGIKKVKRRNPETNEIIERKEVTWKSIRRLDPSCVRITRDPKTQEKIFYYEVPAHLVKVIKTKRPKDEYDRIPNIFKEAVKKKGVIRLNSRYVYDFSMPSESGDNGLWATPPILHAMKLIMYTNVLRQAQEAIAYEHIIPKRIYYFEPGTQHDASLNFIDVADDFAFELKKQINDPNYQVISPIPVQQVNHGGQGRNLLLVPEIEQNNKQILAAMNVPQEFIFGGVSYSGSTTSLRILENDFITYRGSLLDFVNNFIIKRLAEERGEWETTDDDNKLISVTFADLKMQDDIQQKELMVRLNQQGKLSDEILFEKVLGLDASKVKKQMQVEARENIENQMELQAYQMELQSKLQQELQAKGITPPAPQAMPMEGQEGLEGQGEQQTQQPTEESETGQAETGQQEQQGPTEEALQNLAQELSQVDENEALSYIAGLDPSIQQKVHHYYQIIMDNKDMQADMRPYPDQLPPRREGGV